MAKKNPALRPGLFNAHMTVRLRAECLDTGIEAGNLPGCRIGMHRAFAGSAHDFRLCGLEGAAATGFVRGRPAGNLTGRLLGRWCVGHGLYPDRYLGLVSGGDRDKGAKAARPDQKTTAAENRHRLGAAYNRAFGSRQRLYR